MIYKHDICEFSPIVYVSKGTLSNAANQKMVFIPSLNNQNITNCLS